MNPGEALSNVLARDTRYTIEAYAFVFEALEYARNHLRPKRSRFQATRVPPHPYANHVTGQELCEGGSAARPSAVRQARPHDSGRLGHPRDGRLRRDRLQPDRLRHHGENAHRLRADFDNVYDFKTAFEPEYPGSSTTRWSDLIRPEQTRKARNNTMDAPRRRFLMACLLYAAWLAALVGMIALEGRTPPASVAEPAACR